MKKKLREATNHDVHHAYCQAGHAVMAWLEGIEIKQICLAKTGTSWTEVEYDWISDPDGPDRDLVMAVVRGLLAGHIAERRYAFGGGISELDMADLQGDLLDEGTIWQAIELVGRFGDTGAPILPRAWQETGAVINTPRVWAAVEAVAAALLRKHELSGGRIAAIAVSAMRKFQSTNPLDETAALARTAKTHTAGAPTARLKYEYFEKDGAVFRRPASERLGAPVSEVFANGRWQQHRGDSVAPVVYGNQITAKEAGEEE